VAENSIELVNLTKKYGSFTAVDNLNLAIRKGEVFGLLGPNGAGKSTTILMMLGLTEPTSGSVKVCNIDSTTNPIEVKRRVGYLPEDVGFYDDHTGLENLVYTARLNGLSGNESKKKARELINRVGLTDAALKKTGKYSRGMIQRLGLADVLIKNPEVVILDEPTLGIDPTGVREFLELIVALSKEEGITVLFSSHHLHQVQQVCDRVGLFVSGKLLAEGNIQTLSEKLFASAPYIIETSVVEINGKGPVSSVKKFNVDWLSGILKPVEGIVDITLKDSVFRIECSGDVAPQIASAIVGSGAGLSYLNRKAYGLDDIYYRYFEGGKTNE
jgi:ABC-2 type transport system ATP-binding protein